MNGFAQKNNISIKDFVGFYITFLSFAPVENFRQSGDRIGVKLPKIFLSPKLNQK